MMSVIIDLDLKARIQENHVTFHGHMYECQVLLMDLKDKVICSSVLEIVLNDWLA